MASDRFPTRAQLFLAAVGELAMTYRETAGLSVEEAASAAGVSADALEEFERGQRDLTIVQLQALADVIEATVLELLDVGGTELGLSLG